MKFPVLIFLAVIFSFELYAQTNDFNQSLHPSTVSVGAGEIFVPKGEIESKLNSARNNRITLGMGFRKAFPTKSDISIDDKVYFTLTSGLLFHINKPFYLYAGADIFKGFSEGANLNLSLMPALEFSLLKNKFQLMLGAGGVVTMTIGQTEGGMLLGLAGMVRPQYRINKKFAIALELKHNDFLKESTGKFIIITGACFTYYY